MWFRLPENAQLKDAKTLESFVADGVTSITGGGASTETP
jgi:hypothetical protein